MKSFISLALVALLLLLPLGEKVARQALAASGKPIALKAGVAAPDFTLKTPQGKSLSLKSFRGKPVLLNFWATWCGPCVEEMPFFQQLAKEWADRGLVVLGVNEGDGASKVTGFMQRYGLTFPMVLDPDQEVSRLYSVRFMPTSVLVDKDGIIQAVSFGGFESKEQLVAKMLSRLNK
ncbi:MAG: TlpA disulfide reductase family protein [Deltaproteobacteria bacterium]|nr:TlpA disulfide reductase family protein [Deltaproteobacteria bacterium]